MSTGAQEYTTALRTASINDANAKPSICVRRGWAVKWRSGPDNVDRKVCQHLLGDWGNRLPYGHHPLLFQTRRAAREWAKEHYGYIAARPDLRKYPHDWKPPQVVRVRMTMVEMEKE